MAQPHLRSIIVNLGMLAMSAPEAYLVHHDGLFGTDGQLTDPRTESFLAHYVDNFVDSVGRFSRRRGERRHWRCFQRSV
ncbi:hypothetical protein [Devosia rhizoryzae]|uniref:Uncharacterized protein n=1 Tax=Devosia rhizoryzae TaxID=2774137 RepID=A0ABX7C4V1_9HYPH|nr:hypothetical protein [Devosia rhizoryzae]QQR39273.1 hypothetical protein JI748_16355 [Devosia rhizoryzae]